MRRDLPIERPTGVRQLPDIVDLRVDDRADGPLQQWNVPIDRPIELGVQLGRAM